MKFYSTRGKSVYENAAAAISKGLAEDGGLFVPETFPCLKESLANMLEMDYAERACLVIHSFLQEYDKIELDGYEVISHNRNIATLRNKPEITFHATEFVNAISKNYEIEDFEVNSIGVDEILAKLYTDLNL